MAGRAARRAVVVGLAGLLVAGCGEPVRPAGTTAVARAASPSSSASSPSASPTPSASPKGEGAVSVLALRDYVEYGGDDPEVNWVSPFEESTGCKVSLTSVGDAEQLAERFAARPYDVLSAPPELAGELIDRHKVAVLTTSRIPGYDHVAARLRGLPSVEQDGRVYGVPYLWGFHQVLYDTRKVGRKRAASGWAGLIAGPGPVALPDSPMTIADAALALKGGLRPADPYELTPEQLDAAMELLARHKDSGRVYWDLDLPVVAGFAAGRLQAAQALPYHLAALKRAGLPVRAAGQARTTGWADAWMMSAETERPTCAYQWIGYMISTRVQRQAAAWTGLAPAVPAACGGDAKRVCEAYDVKDVLGKGTGAFRRIAFAERPSKDCDGAEGECTDYAQWTERWQELVK